VEVSKATPAGIIQTEEVSMISSDSIKGLRIAENAA